MDELILECMTANTETKVWIKRRRQADLAIDGCKHKSIKSHRIDNIRVHDKKIEDNKQQWTNQPYLPKIYIQMHR